MTISEIHSPEALEAGMREKAQRARADQEDAALRVVKAKAEIALTNLIIAKMTASVFPQAAIAILVALRDPETKALAAAEKKLAAAEKRTAAALRAVEMAHKHVEMQAKGASGTWYVKNSPAAAAHTPAPAAA